MIEEQGPVAVLYREFGAALCGLMQNRFGVPEEDAENLLHDIFETLLRSQSAVANEKKWLVGAACNASRYYWRQQKEQVDVAEETTIGSKVDVDVTLEQILGRLPERASEVLRLKYLEGLSGDEIAERYGTSVEYTHVLIHRSLRKARALAEEDRR